MISRRLIRIKVLQVLYAYSKKNEGYSSLNAEKELFYSIDKFYDLYLLLLLLINEMANFEKARTHLLATYGETARIGSTGTSYMWGTTDGASISLKYSETPQQGYVFFFNRIVAK